MKSYAGKLKFTLLALAVFTLGMVWFGAAHGYAQPGGRAAGCGYFDNRCFIPSGNSLYTPVFNAGISAGLSSLGNGAVENKAQFINFMGSMLGGTAQERTGAAFLIDLMVPSEGRTRAPNFALFAAAINQGNVTLRFNTNQNYLGWNSGYQNLYHPLSNTFTLFDNDDAFFPEAGSAPAMDVYQNGALVFIVKQTCGNPLGGLGGVAAGWTLTSSSSVSVPVAQPGQTVTFTNNITDVGPTAASFWQTVQDAYPSPTYVNESSFPESLVPGATFTANESYTIPAAATAGSLYCQRIVYSNATGPGTANSQSAPACVKVIILTCGNGVTTPDPLQPGDTIGSLKASINYSGGLPAYTGMTLTIAPPFNGAGYTATATGGNITVTGTSVTGTFTGLPVTSTAGAANYTMTWQLMNGAVVAFGPCNGGFGTRNLPYFSVYGASVSAGGDFDDNGSGCTNTAGNGTISSYYDNQTAFAGANTFLAAVALGQITGFASAQQQTGGATGNRPFGLTFADTGAGVNITTDAFLPKLGGSYSGAGGGGTSCLFTPKLPGGTPTNPSPGTVDVSTLAPGAHSYNGDLTLTSGGGIPAANNVSVFVNGNVYISNNIDYALGGWSVTPGSVNNVPSFTLKVTGGNIYIADSVTELDGVYAAEANAGTGGTIYTCGSAYTPDLAANLYNCRNQLIIYGSFVADQVNLMRTYGTLRDAVTGEWPGGGSNVCSGGPNAPVCGAEVFEFSPELYLSDPAIQQPSTSTPVYNSISSLPPVL